MAFEVFPINSPHCVHFSVLHILNCFMPFAVKLQVEKITIWVESKIKIKFIFLKIYLHYFQLFLIPTHVALKYVIQ